MHPCSVFCSVSNNFPEMEVIILMNKFIRIQISINGSRQVDVFVLFCQNTFLETKGQVISTNRFYESVHLRLEKSLNACSGFYNVSGNRSTYDGSTL